MTQPRDKYVVEKGDGTRAVICAKGVTLMHFDVRGICDRFAVISGKPKSSFRAAGGGRGSRSQRGGGRR